MKNVTITLTVQQVDLVWVAIHRRIDYMKSLSDPSLVEHQQRVLEQALDAIGQAAQAEDEK